MRTSSFWTKFIVFKYVCVQRKMPQVFARRTPTGEQTSVAVRHALLSHEEKAQKI